MLEIKNVSKSYKIGDYKQTALEDINIKFRKSEFVCILGTSGSGKTTLLNLIGGLDNYDSGDLIINGKSTKKFTSSNWDAYRNSWIGFIFQNYNLINHISVIQNVEIAMTLSGVGFKKRRKKALQVLEKVGLKNHVNKKPSQLSGGQMQRVAIARALVNDPNIILADEPTGALDSKTSVQIMDLIKKVAKDKLVIMVTHNADIAKKYSNRIIKLSDGSLISDTNPLFSVEELEDSFKIKKTSMNFITALKLSLNNVFTKKGRTVLTSFASSIGIIGIALILSLSNGFNKQINKFEKE
ncbi:MAG: ABC transporter ATP-binding protein, partial [Bacilli bacterium]